MIENEYQILFYMDDKKNYLRKMNCEGIVVIYFSSADEYSSLSETTTTSSDTSRLPK